MQHVATPSHLEHDPSLIAGHAAGDLTHSQVSAASALIASCPDCAELHRDLVAISAATRALPRQARSPRDFRLTAEQAASLRRGSWLRAILRPFGSAQSAVRPLATAFTSLGVAGLLVAAFMPAMLGGAAAGPTSQERDAVTAAGAPAPSEAAGPVDPLAGVPGASGGTTKGDIDASPAPAFNGQGGEARATEETDGSGAFDLQDAATRQTPSNLLLMGSLGLLLVGLVFFGLRLAARRVR
jgi:anti-sigma factor RsiW